MPVVTVENGWFQEKNRAAPDAFRFVCATAPYRSALICNTFLTGLLIALTTAIVVCDVSAGQFRRHSMKIASAIMTRGVVLEVCFAIGAGTGARAEETVVL